MVLYIIGLGLGTERDITLRGLDAIKSSSLLFLESYTSVLCVSSEKLEALYEKPVTIATRDMVESECHLIVDPAKEQDVSFLVVGDPVCATTHTDIMIR
jgi:diphthine synthase